LEISSTPTALEFGFCILIFTLKGKTMKKAILFYLILALGVPFVFLEEPQRVQADDAQTTPTPVSLHHSSKKVKKSKHHPKTVVETKPESMPAARIQAADEENEDPLYIGLGTGVDMPLSGWDPNYLLGGGANVFVGYTLDKNLAVQLDGEQWFFTGTGYSLYNFRVLAEAKYTFAGQGWQPYLIAGPGLVFQAISPSGDSTTNFDALAGAGVQFDIAPRTHLFIEAKYNFIMSSTTTFSDIPVSAGLWVGL
jgi:hypothetical protein